MYQESRGSFNFHYYSGRLQKKLKLLDSSPVAIVEAPSGYGKTTAVRDYLKNAAEYGGNIYWFTAVD